MPRALPSALVLLAASLATMMSPWAQAPVDSPACRAGPARQFDFWLGRWEVFLPDGSRAGINHIQSVAGGCALLEHWQGRGGFTGHSLNRYDPAARRWQQWWMDSGGSLLMLSGGWQEGTMALSGESADPAQPDRPRHERIRWTPMADGSVRQLWEQSDDRGTTWRVVFDGRYVRLKPAT